MRILNITGTILSVLLVAFVLFRGYQGLDLSLISAGMFFPKIILALVVISFATFLLPLNYSYILRGIYGSEGPGLSFRAGVIYGETQIMKYLPGNVFHFVGRQIRLGKLGVPQLVTGNTSLTEMLSLVLVAAGISALFGGQALPGILEQLGLDSSEKFVLVLAGIALLTAFCWIYFFFRRKRIEIDYSHLLRILAVHAGFFLFSAAGFWLVIRGFGLDSVAFTESVMIFSVAWLLGTIIPGASAGIGVREAIIIALGQIMAGVDLAVVAIVLRMITVVADLLMWAVSSALAVREGEKTIEI